MQLKYATAICITSKIAFVTLEILQLTSATLDSKLREDLERMKKIRAHRGMRHYWGLRVRGQHTKTTGRRGRTVGVSKKK